MKKLLTLLWAIACANLLQAQQLTAVGGGIQGLYINDLFEMGNKIYAGGYFTPGGVAKDHVFYFDGAQWQPMKGGVSGITFPFITSFVQYNNKLYMCGGFKNAGPYTTNDVAVWDGYDWADPAGGVLNAKSLAVYKNQLYAGTSTILSNGGKKALLWRWNGTQWENLTDSFEMAANPNLDLQGIHAMTEYKGKLVVAGMFKSINGMEVNNIATWDGLQWDTLASGTNGYIRALQVWGDSLYAGGAFNAIGMELTNNMARWHNGKWYSMGAGIDQRVTEFGVYNGRLWIGGDFFTPNRGVLTYDGSNFTIPFTPDDGVGAFLNDGNSLIIGGDFEQIDGQNFSLVVRYTENTASVGTPIKGSIGFYPNPATDVLNITHTGSGESEIQVTVFDNMGRRVLDKAQPAGETTLPIGSLPAGVYHISLLQGNVHSSGSFIKQ